MHYGPARCWTRSQVQYVRTSGWEVCGSRAMNGLSEEPGRRYSGGAPFWLVVSVFVLLKERFRLFPLCKLESAPVIKGELSVSLFTLYLCIRLLSMGRACVCTWCLCVCESLQHTWRASLSQRILRSRRSQQLHHTSQMESGWADGVRFWKDTRHYYNADNV